MIWAILSMGQIKKCGYTKDLLAQQDNKLLIIYPEHSIKTLPKFSETVSASIREDGALLFSFNKSEITAEKILEQFKDLGHLIKDFSTAEPALEDVFKKVINSK